MVSWVPRDLSPSITCLHSTSLSHLFGTGQRLSTLKLKRKHWGIRARVGGSPLRLEGRWAWVRVYTAWYQSRAQAELSSLLVSDMPESHLCSGNSLRAGNSSSLYVITDVSHLAPIQASGRGTHRTREITGAASPLPHLPLCTWTLEAGQARPWQVQLWGLRALPAADCEHWIWGEELEPITATAEPRSHG